MKNLLFMLPLLALLLFSCEKESICTTPCNANIDLLDICDYKDLDTEMANFNLNLSRMVMTKEIITPLVWDGHSYSYREGIVQYLVDGQPITQINYEVGNRQGIRTDFMVYNAAAPCESQTTSCLFEQPTVMDWCDDNY